MLSAWGYKNWKFLNPLEEFIFSEKYTNTLMLWVGGDCNLWNMIKAALPNYRKPGALGKTDCSGQFGFGLLRERD